MKPESIMNRFFRVINSTSWIAIIARLGFIAKGIIYFSIGLLAFQIAIGMGGKTYGSTQMLEHFIYQPYGTILLIFCLAGLIAHAVWKLLNGYYEIESLGQDFSGLFFRFIEIIVGLLYLSLSYATFQILTGNGAQSSNKSTEIWITKILTLPYGKWIVLAVALVVVIMGGYQFYYVYTEGFDYRIDFTRMNQIEKKGLYLAAKTGLGAWGIVYFMIGFLLFQAAKNTNPDQAGGLGKALSALQQQPYGTWVLGATAVGLLIYGLYLFVLSYYHTDFSID